MVAGSGYPNVHCNTELAPPSRAVNSVVSDIYTYKDRQTFGPVGATGVQVGLPADLNSGELSQL